MQLAIELAKVIISIVGLFYLISTSVIRIKTKSFTIIIRREKGE